MACALVPTSHAEAAAATDYAERVLAAVNEYRAQHGLAPVRPAAALDRIAASHSLAMAAQRRASHGGFAARFGRAGSDLCVENIAAGFVVPEQTVLGWRASPAHDRNLLEPRVRWVGLVSVERYTTLFACDSDGGKPALR